MVFQDPYGSLNPRMTVRQVLAEALSVHRMRPRAEIPGRIAELLDLVRLPPDAADRLPHAVLGRAAPAHRHRPGAGGRARRCSSPTNSSRRSTSRCRRRWSTCCSTCRSGCGLTVLFVAHDLRLVRHISHRVAVMYLGAVVEIGETEALFSRPAPPLYAGAARCRAGPRPGAPHRRGGGAGRAAEPPRAAAGLPLPHALPVRLRPLPHRAPGADARAAGPRRAACHLDGFGAAR